MNAVLLRILRKLPWSRQLRVDAERAARQNRAAERRLDEEKSLAPERIRSAEAVTNRVAQNHLSEAWESLYDRRSRDIRWQI